VGVEDKHKTQTPSGRFEGVLFGARDLAIGAGIVTALLGISFSGFLLGGGVLAHVGGAEARSRRLEANKIVKDNQKADEKKTN
jgi:hypothetical protein